MNKLVALLRVKDGILFINDWLRVMEKLVDEIVVVDNGSTDGTLEILKKHPLVADVLQTVGFDEGRDKILVYEMARKRNPDWCIWLDVDEIFEERMTRAALDEMMASKEIMRYKFRRYDFIKDEKHFFLYTESLMHTFSYSRTLWREQSSGYFLNAKIHNGEIKGITGKRAFSKFRIKHLGYTNNDYVNTKTNNYINVDPDNKNLYLKHFEKRRGFNILWREYKGNEFTVGIQLLFYRFMFYVIVFLEKIKNLFNQKINGNE